MRPPSAVSKSKTPIVLTTSVGPAVRYAGGCTRAHTFTREAGIQIVGGNGPEAPEHVPPGCRDAKTVSNPTLPCPSMHGQNWGEQRF